MTRENKSEWTSFHSMDSAPVLICVSPDHRNMTRFKSSVLSTKSAFFFIRPGVSFSLFIAFWVKVGFLQFSFALDWIQCCSCVSFL